MSPTYNQHHLEEKLLLFSGENGGSHVPNNRSDDEKKLEKYSKLLSTFITGKSPLKLNFSSLNSMCVNSACGNFSVQYNFQSISIALLIMSAAQCTIDDDACKGGEQAGWVFSTASASVFVGAIMGQLTVRLFPFTVNLIFICKSLTDGICWRLVGQKCCHDNYIRISGYICFSFCFCS